MVLHRCLRVLLRGLEGDKLMALAAALLFASHPVHTEAIAGWGAGGRVLCQCIAGIVGRADVLAAICGGFAFLAFARSVPQDEIRPTQYYPCLECLVVWPALTDALQRLC